MNFDLNEQELSILISSMQYMTHQQENRTANPKIIANLYNKLTSRHDYIQRIRNEYVCDA